MINAVFSADLTKYKKENEISRNHFSSIESGYFQDRIPVFCQKFSYNAFFSKNLISFFNNIFQLHNLGKSSFIADIVGFSSDPDFFYIFYERPDNSKILDLHYLSNDEKMELIEFSAKSCYFLHSHGIDHGRIKPSSFILIPDKTFKLAFFQPKYTSLIEDEDSFLPLEPNDLESSDIYLFGILIAECLTNEPQSIILQRLWKSLPALPEPLANHKFAPLINRCLDFCPFLRPSFSQINEFMTNPLLFNTPNSESSKKNYTEIAKSIINVIEKNSNPKDLLKSETKDLNQITYEAPITRKSMICHTLNLNKQKQKPLSSDVIQCLEKLCESSSEFGLTILGSHLISTDKDRSFQLLSKAHTTISQNNIGMILMSSNPQQSFQFFKEAADRGYSIAQKNIAIAYNLGKGIEKNEDKRKEYMKKAADQGYLEAICYYAKMCEEDFIKEKNEIKEKRDKKMMSKNETNSLASEEDISPLEPNETTIDNSNISQKIEESRKYFEVAAFRGMPEALLMIIAHYEDYNGTLDKMLLFGRVASALGIPEAQVMLANQLSDPTQIMDLFYAAAIQGSPRAMYFLGEKLIRGDGCKKDINEGVYWTKRGAELGNPDAMQNFSILLLHGIGVEKNRKAAEMWCKKASIGRMKHL